MGCHRLLGGRVVAGTGMWFIPRLIPVGFPRPVFVGRRLVLSARVGATAIFIIAPLLRLWIPFVSFNSWHMGTESRGI